MPFKRKRKIPGGNNYSKAASRNLNLARTVSESDLQHIETDLYKEKKAKNLTKPSLGPRMLITNYIQEKGPDVTDEEIIKYMQECMKSLTREYILNLIYQIRESEKNKNSKERTEGYDR